MRSRQLLSYFFVIMAVLIALLSLWLSNGLVNKLAEEERRKMEIWAMATESMMKSEDEDMSLVLMVLESNTTIPLLLYDERSGEMTPRNLKLPEENIDSYLQEKKKVFAQRHDPIALHEMGQLLYYDDSHTLKMLQRYPYLQLIVIAFFISLAFYAFYRSQRAERDRVWVGLSKETAHQLGTPISSLMAWMEYMKLKDVDPEMLIEIEKDISRLRVIAERFSKIGAASSLKAVDLRAVVADSVAYLEKRVSHEVVFSSQFPDHPVMVSLNEPLFGWVIENLVKNAVDAMQGKGFITMVLSKKGQFVLLDISDTGKGIPKSKFKTIFSPGYTTKERGWGLGLTLVKRIVVEIHRGDIFVKRSEPGKGTSFRIQLKKN